MDLQLLLEREMPWESLHLILIDPKYDDSTSIRFLKKCPYRRTGEISPGMITLASLQTCPGLATNVQSNTKISKNVLLYAFYFSSVLLCSYHK